MPLGAPGQRPQRQEPVYDDAQIRALTEYVVGFGGDGPEIPQVREGGEVHRGWELYTANCAACHAATGAGNAVGGGNVAYGLGNATAVHVAEAMPIGPGVMPRFQLDDTDVAAHVDDAADWLVSVQKKNGAFGSDNEIPTANGNSTGAAAYALLLAGRTAPAAKAAAWLRAHQATNVANCVFFAGADRGAVLYDDAARSAAQSGPMDAELRYQTVRSTSQALLGLLAAETGPGTPNVLSAPGYLKAGSATQVGVNDAAPGDPLCAMLGEQSVLGWANPQGDASLKVLLPKKAGTSTVQVANAAGPVGKAKLTTLGATKLPVSVKAKRIGAGQKQVVTVKGLAPGETAQVAVAWPAKKNSGSVALSGGQANRRGVFTVTVKVPNRPGTAEVEAQGQYKFRKGAASFTVTR